MNTKVQSYALIDGYNGATLFVEEVHLSLRKSVFSSYQFVLNAHASQRENKKKISSNL